MLLFIYLFITEFSLYRGPPIPLHNMLSRKNILPFHESRKIEKIPSRSRKNRSDHDSRKNKTKFTNYYRMSSLIVESLYSSLLTSTCFQTSNYVENRLLYIKYFKKQQQTVFIPWKADHTKQMIHESRIFLSAIHGSRLIRIFPSRARKNIESHTHESRIKKIIDHVSRLSKISPSRFTQKV
jgi:hypothetical protein